MVPIARLNLLADKARFIAAVGGVAFSVTLILLVQALYAGFHEAAASFVEKLPADVWVLQSGSFDLFRSTSILPATAADDVARVPGVAAVQAGRARQLHFLAGDRDVYSLLIAFGSDPGEGISDTLGLSHLPGPGEIVLSDYVRREGRLSVGDRITVGGVNLTVSGNVGVKSPPFGSFSVINYDDADRIMDLSGGISYVLVAAQDKAHAAELARTIEQAVRGTDATEKYRFAKVNSKNVDQFLPVMGVLLAVSYLVGSAVASLTIYTATIERTHEFGVLKALGAASGFIYKLVLSQSFIICVLGFVIGVPFALALSWVAKEHVIEFMTDYQPVSVVITLVAVMLMGFTASWFPARRVSSIDPASAFRA